VALIHNLFIINNDQVVRESTIMPAARNHVSEYSTLLITHNNKKKDKRGIKDIKY